MLRSGEAKATAGHESVEQVLDARSADTENTPTDPLAQVSQALPPAQREAIASDIDDAVTFANMDTVRVSSHHSPVNFVRSPCRPTLKARKMQQQGDRKWHSSC